MCTKQEGKRMPRLSDLHDAERELDAALIAKEQLQRKITGIRADIARLKKLGDKTAWYPGPIPVVPVPQVVLPPPVEAPDAMLRRFAIQQGCETREAQDAWIEKHR
jgi:hypothetical protein